MYFGHDINTAADNGLAAIELVHKMCPQGEFSGSKNEYRVVHFDGTITDALENPVAETTLDDVRRVVGYVGGVAAIERSPGQWNVSFYIPESNDEGDDYEEMPD
jgi:hypothetical protein